MKVEVIYTFEVDMLDFDPKFVNVKGLAIDLTRREMESLLKHGDLTVDSFKYVCKEV